MAQERKEAGREGRHPRVSRETRLLEYGGASVASLRAGGALEHQGGSEKVCGAQ